MTNKPVELVLANAIRETLRLLDEHEDAVLAVIEAAIRRAREEPHDQDPLLLRVAAIRRAMEEQVEARIAAVEDQRRVSGEDAAGTGGSTP